jgi:hypothetical protein
MTQKVDKSGIFVTFQFLIHIALLVSLIFEIIVRPHQSVVISQRVLKALHAYQSGFIQYSQS